MLIEFKPLTGRDDRIQPPLSFILYCIAIAVYFKVASHFSAAWTENAVALYVPIEIIYTSLIILIVVASRLTHKSNQFIDFVFGFGFFMMAVCNVLCILCLPDIKIYTATQYYVFQKYWLIGRITEATIMFIGTLNLSYCKLKRWLIPLVASILIINAYYTRIFPAGLFSELFTIKKTDSLSDIYLWSTTGVLLLLCICNLSKTVNFKEMFTNKQCCIATLATIVMQGCCMTMWKYRFFNILGYGIRIFTCCFLIIAIFINYIIKPYRKLETVNRHIKDLIDGFPSGIIALNKKLDILYVNKRALELTGGNLNKILEFSQRRTIKEYQDKTCDGRELICGELHGHCTKQCNIISITDRKHKKRTLQINKHAMKNGQLMFTLREITKEQEFERLQKQTQAMINSINNVVLICDSKGNVVMCNKLFHKMAGTGEKEVMGTNIKHLTETLQLEKRRLYRGKPQCEYPRKPHYIATIVTGNGKKKELLLQISPVYGSGGETIGSAIIASDITELKKKQDRIAQAKMLALLGQQSAAIAHETKNCLATVKGYCQLLKKTARNKTIKEYVQKIDKAIEEANRIAVEFLALAKPKTCVFEKISLNNLLVSMMQILKEHPLTHGIKIDIQLAQKDELVMCDEMQIKQVILNICINAAEAMDGVEKPLLKLKTEFNHIKNQMHIIVSDNGCGIPQENICYLGTPFFTTKKKGTGLGLTVCYGIIKNHCGKIEVDSIVQQGTTFIISLPCHSEDKQALTN